MCHLCFIADHLFSASLGFAELPEARHTQPELTEADFEILSISMIILNGFVSS